MQDRECGTRVSHATLVLAEDLMQHGLIVEALGADRRPRSDATNAFAAIHTWSAAPFVGHATSTLPFSNTGEAWASCCAREVKTITSPRNALTSRQS